MKIRTGQTVYENILFDNTITSFTATLIKDGSVMTGVTININSIISASTSTLHSFSWSASTFGDYQLYLDKPQLGSTIPYLSNHYFAVSDDEAMCAIYIGI